MTKPKWKSQMTEMMFEELRTDFTASRNLGTTRARKRWDKFVVKLTTALEFAEACYDEDCDNEDIVYDFRAVLEVRGSLLNAAREAYDLRKHPETVIYPLYAFWTL